jgi:hypothetical protein
MAETIISERKSGFSSKTTIEPPVKAIDHRTLDIGRGAAVGSASWPLN